MKQLIFTLTLVLSVNLMTSQDLAIETKSVTLTDLISFVVDEINTNTEDANGTTRHITFLLQISVMGLSTEDKIIVKQALKLASDRLTDKDNISILTYSGFNGTALPKTSAKAYKSIAYTVEHLKSSIKQFYKDGIGHAYNYAEAHYQHDAKNTIIMVRNPNASKVSEQLTTTETVPKKNNGAAIVTAIALLPELISAIKN